MSIIETEIWETENEMNNQVRCVGQRKAEEVFNELSQYLKDNDIYPDEYFLLNRQFANGALLPKIADVMCYAQWGGSEGVYLEVDFLAWDENEHLYKQINFATGKTLGETNEDFDRTQYIAGCIYRAFT